jgi:hypothetical protein
MSPNIFDEPSTDESEKIIMDLANSIFDYDMDLVAILFLETFKPFVSVYGQMGRFMVAPFLPLVGDSSMKYLATFQNKENLEKLISELERKSREDEAAEREQRKNMPKKTGWRKYLPF